MRSLHLAPDKKEILPKTPFYPGSPLAFLMLITEAGIQLTVALGYELLANCCSFWACLISCYIFTPPPRILK